MVSDDERRERRTRVKALTIAGLSAQQIADLYRLLETAGHQGPEALGDDAAPALSAAHAVADRAGRGLARRRVFACGGRPHVGRERVHDPEALPGPRVDAGTDRRAHSNFEKGTLMAWFKVDDGLPTSRKVMSLPRSVRLQAIGLWTLAGAWSASQELDGYVPDYMVTELGGTARIVSALVKSGLWEKVSTGAQFNKWAEYQPMRADLEAARQKEADRKRRWRARHRPGGVPLGQDGGREPESDYPDPTRPDPTPNKGVPAGGDLSIARETSPKCDAHKDDPFPPNCGRCADARRAVEVSQAEFASVAAARRQQEQDDRVFAVRREIEACGLCDDRGYRSGRVCSHDPDEDARRARGIAEARAQLEGRAS